jgi:membrane peptidoglycan carboxypeptidase
VNRTREMKALLRATVESGIAGRARAVGWSVYGKTGTTNNYSDAWFVGFDNRLAVGVWSEGMTIPRLIRAFIELSVTICMYLSTIISRMTGAPYRKDCRLCATNAASCVFRAKGITPFFSLTSTSIVPKGCQYTNDYWLHYMQHRGRAFFARPLCFSKES